MRQQRPQIREEPLEEGLWLRPMRDTRGRIQDYKLDPNHPLPEVIGCDTPEAAQKLVEWAERLGRFLVRRDPLTTSQIRKVFGEVRRIEMDARRQWTDTVARKLRLLIPKIEYAARQSLGAKALRAVLVPAIHEVLQGDNARDCAERFRRFVDFFEAILAYHQAAGGR